MAAASHNRTPWWGWLWPLVAAAILATSLFVGMPGPLAALAGAVLIADVFAAVYHAEVVAHRVGEPFGTLILALAVTVIEAALIVSLMAAGGDDAAGLARDTVFAAVMISASRDKMGALVAPRWLTALAALIAVIIIALNLKLISDLLFEG